jgi:hypothetical protein
MVDVIELKALACADCGETAIVKQWSDRAKATAFLAFGRSGILETNFRNAK